MRRLTVISVSVLACVLCGSTPVLAQKQPRLIPLDQAASLGDVAQIKLHIEKKTDLNKPNALGNSPLKLAIASTSVDAVKALLDGGANPDVQDDEGSTPLMNASIAGQRPMVEALLAAKADLKVTNNVGWTALHAAVMAGQYEIIEVLLKAGSDINAKNKGGETPYMMAKRRSQLEIMALLRDNGATVPEGQTPYGGDIGGPDQPQAAAASLRPTNFVIDPNVIRKQIEETPTLQAPLKVIDANGEGEQRTWIVRRGDNRTAMLRAVQKQFEEEMAFVKRVATDEKAEKTAKAVDDLVAARKSRYKLIGEELRDQRRQTLQESRETGTTGRGGTSARSGRGRGSTQESGSSPQARSPRRGATEVQETPVDPDAQMQIQSWLNAKAEQKGELLKTVQNLDVIEYANLHRSAEEEKAAKTQVAIMGLLMLREQRAARIELKWKDEDERTQRMQERTGTTGAQDTQNQQGTRRGGRR